MAWTLRGLRNGIVTTRWPRRPDAYFDRFTATVTTNEQSKQADPSWRDHADRIVDLCPTDAISIGADGGPVIDQGRCIACGRCVRAAPESFAWQSGSATAALTRRRLVVGDVEETDASLAEIRLRLSRKTTRLRRSVHIRHVDAGSDGSDEWEVQALINPVYDVHRLGIFFTASPRHADILLVTGVGAGGMAAPLARTRAAMPDPVIVIAAGTDAVSGGLMGGAYHDGHGIEELLDVDVWVPGSPASPFALLHGILLALDRLPSQPRGGA